MRTESDANVAEGAAGDGHVDGELGVAEGGEEGAEAGNGVGEDDGGAGVEAAGAAGGDEDPCADHATEAESDEVEPAEAAAHVGAGAGPGAAHLVEGGGGRAGAPGDAARRVGEGQEVRLEARKRGGAMAVHH